MTSTRILLVFFTASIPFMTFAQERVDIFADPENLKVLPEDISSDELSNTMPGFATVLGVG